MEQEQEQERVGRGERERMHKLLEFRIKIAPFRLSN